MLLSVFISRKGKGTATFEAERLTTQHISTALISFSSSGQISFCLSFQRLGVLWSALTVDKLTKPAFFMLVACHGGASAALYAGDVS